MFRAPESEQTDLQDISIEAVEPTATETTDSTEPLPQAEGAQAVQEANPPVGDIDSDTIEAPLAPENQDTMPTIDTDISLNDVPRAPQEESNTTSELAEPSTKENKPHEEHLVFKNPDEDVAK